MRAGSRVKIGKLSYHPLANKEAILIIPAFNLMSQSGKWWSEINGVDNVHVYDIKTGNITHLNNDWVTLIKRPSIIKFLHVLFWQCIYFLIVQPLLITPLDFPHIWSSKVRRRAIDAFVERKVECVT